MDPSVSCMTGRGSGFLLGPSQLRGFWEIIFLSTAGLCSGEAETHRKTEAIRQLPLKPVKNWKRMSVKAFRKCMSVFSDFCVCVGTMQTPCQIITRWQRVV
ncbi:hypothetical protein ILYODFUR_017065 [Ilyodon furcidens]|uniref:Uncharacterized protein n=1 Tax=Ilyodon furcidens TaxID=33524 RepID=A0ABV0T0E8_9TELE